MLRRHFGIGMLWLALARTAGATMKSADETPLRVLTRGRAQVFLFGFGDARDDSWATPELRRAFDASETLWLEVSPDPGSEPDAAEKREQLARHADGRSFFDALEPAVRVRAMAYCEQLGISPERIASQRPWSAYSTINRAYWSRHKASFESRNPAQTLTKWAKEQAKPIRYEMPSQLDFARFMSSMPDAAQSQYMTFLFDFLDDQTAGRNQNAFDWIDGNAALAERAVERMRTRTPDLYRIMQVQRNAWWARTIDELLTSVGKHFIGVGQMHTLGPDGIPAQLGRIELR